MRPGISVDQIRTAFASRLKYSLAQIGGALIAFMATPILTRMYDARTYGQYLLIVSMVAFMSAVATQWVQQGILRFLPGNPEVEALRAQLASTTTMISVIVAVISMLVVPWLPGLTMSVPETLLIGIYSGCVAAGAVQSSIRLALEHTEDFSRYIFLQGAAPLIFAILSSLIGVDLIYLLWSQAFGGFLTLLVIKTRFKYVKPEWGVIKQSFMYGLPLSAWVISAQLLNNLDRFMIAYYIGARAAGIYATNYNIVFAMQGFLFGPLLLSAHPQLMKLWNDRDPHYQDMLRHTIRSFILCATLSVGFFMTSYHGLGYLLLGSDFREGAALMPVIATGNALWGFSAYLNKGFEFKRETWKLAIMAVPAALINFILNLIFIPRYGIAAAAYTTLIAFAWYLFITHCYSPKSIKITLDIADFIIIFVVPCTMLIVGQIVASIRSLPILLQELITCCAGLITIGAILALEARGLSLRLILRKYL